MDDGGAVFEARQRRADEGVGRVQEMVAAIGAAGVAEVMHAGRPGGGTQPGDDSFEHRSIIAQGAQELHSGGECGLDIFGQHDLVGVVAEARGCTQE